MSALIEKVEENWMIYDIIMQHKHMLYHQVASLINQKIKYKKNYLRFRARD